MAPRNNKSSTEPAAAKRSRGKNQNIGLQVGLAVLQGLGSEHGVSLKDLRSRLQDILLNQGIDLLTAELERERREREDQEIEELRQRLAEKEAAKSERNTTAP